MNDSYVHLVGRVHPLKPGNGIYRPGQQVTVDGDPIRPFLRVTLFPHETTCPSCMAAMRNPDRRPLGWYVDEPAILESLNLL